VTHVYVRSRRARGPAVVAAMAVLALALTALAAHARAATAPTHKPPRITALRATPASPIAGKGFKVSFKASAAGRYAVVWSGANAGGVLQLVTAKARRTVTTRVVGKDLAPARRVKLLIEATPGTPLATAFVTIRKK
jgi:hypothetical protein